MAHWVDVYDGHLARFVIDLTGDDGMAIGIPPWNVVSKALEWHRWRFLMRRR